MEFVFAEYKQGTLIDASYYFAIASPFFFFFAALVLGSGR